MNLENLVPPLELCKKIPEGCFEDSALVYCVVGDGSGGERWYLVERKNAGETKYPEIHPAPTMAEIMEALKAEDHEPSCYLRCDTWRVDGVGACKKGHKFPPAYDAGDLNPASAALKLWLELEARK